MYAIRNPKIPAVERVFFFMTTDILPFSVNTMRILFCKIRVCINSSCNERFILEKDKYYRICNVESISERLVNIKV